MLAALMGGKALPAGELAYRAGVTFQTASSHLRILETSGFIRAIKCGRHRYYELTNQNIAEGLETLASSLLVKLPSIPPHLSLARFCYDHLAGQLAVMITQKLISHGAITLNNCAFECHQGHDHLWCQFSLNLNTVRATNQKFAPRCIDWSQRQPHIAGAVGAALATSLQDLHYIVRSPNDRAVNITPLGQMFFDQFLGKGWQDAE